MNSRWGAACWGDFLLVRRSLSQKNCALRFGLYVGLSIGKQLEEFSCRNTFPEFFHLFLSDEEVNLQKRPWMIFSNGIIFVWILVWILLTNRHLKFLDYPLQIIPLLRLFLGWIFLMLHKKNLKHKLLVFSINSLSNECSPFTLIDIHLISEPFAFCYWLQVFFIFTFMYAS